MSHKTKELSKAVLSSLLRSLEESLKVGRALTEPELHVIASVCAVVGPRASAHDLLQFYTRVIPLINFEALEHGSSDGAPHQDTFEYLIWVMMGESDTPR